jgi:hypothetical protein
MIMQRVVRQINISYLDIHSHKNYSNRPSIVYINTLFHSEKVDYGCIQ